MKLILDLVLEPPRYDVIVAGGIALLACIVAPAASIIYARAARSAGIRGGSVRMGILALVSWMIVIGALASGGALLNVGATPPPSLLLFFVTIGGALAIGFSNVGRVLAEHTSLLTLIALQAFRLPLELVMHRAAGLGMMPRELSYGGLNFDIITGAGAVILAVLLILRVGVPRRALWIWNAWGIASLLLVMGLAVAASPMLRMLGTGPDRVNSWVLYFPYVWLPGILVLVAIVSHIVITRKLLGMRRDPVPADAG